MAELKFFGYFAEKAGARAKEIALKTPTRLREILPDGFPEINMIVLINQKPATLDSVVENGDTVLIMPVLSGG